MTSQKRIMVDMSATLIHHGHIRLLERAKALGTVVVALTTDDEILKKKGYMPELNFSERSEIIKSIKYVDEIVPSTWLIDNSFLDLHHIDLLVHGTDNSNPVASERLLVLPRTADISSSLLRTRVLRSLAEIIEFREK